VGCRDGSTCCGDRALLGAYASGRQRVDRAIVDKAAGEVFDLTRRGTGAWSRRPYRPAGAGIAGGCHWWSVASRWRW
jgi:hypothetical protein